MYLSLLPDTVRAGIHDTEAGASHTAPGHAEMAATAIGSYWGDHARVNGPMRCNDFRRSEQDLIGHGARPMTMASAMAGLDPTLSNPVPNALAHL